MKSEEEIRKNIEYREYNSMIPDECESFENDMWIFVLRWVLEDVM